MTAHKTSETLYAYVDMVASGNCPCRGRPASADMRTDAGLASFEAASGDLAIPETAISRWP